MSQRAFYFALFALVLVTALGSVLDVMEVDAAQYAGMARDMVATEDWTKLYFRGKDYLDKPPLLFWSSALSFKLFGVSNWSYKLPSILFAFFGLFSLYRFTRLFYSVDIARVATLMFGVSAAFILMTNDVRCDTLLTASVITSVWLGAAWIEQRKWWQLIGCAVAMALGMLAKGPMGLMAPLLALGGHIIFAKRWSATRDLRWLIPLPIIGLLLVPMCIGLYEQHGTHGIWFFFWEQSFGRITGENRWKDDSTILFFTHEILWQLIPWTIPVLLGIWYSIKGAIKRSLPEYATVFGAVLVFVAVSLSHFKLPHYLYVALPFFCVMAANAWFAANSRVVLVLQGVSVLILWVAALWLTLYAFPEGGGPFAAFLGVTLIVALVYLWRRWSVNSMFIASIWVMIGIALILNGHIQPSILTYQANAQVGKWLKGQNIPKDKFYGLQQGGTAIDFYAGYPILYIAYLQQAREVIAPGVVIYTDPENLSQLLNEGLIPEKNIKLPNYKVQLMGFNLIDPVKRPKALETRYILLY